ncbi:MAG: fumarylacetoacetate hydrolase family protein [Chloroflexi bacterium]|nr:fumarylacetoacetate hydrolase family protein [Chloroflexota bacterium]
MRLARYRGPNGVKYGVMEGDQVREIRGSIFRAFQTTGAVHPLSAVRLLAPCEPSKMLAVALNYRSHLGEQPATKVPEMFFKAPSSVIGPEDSIVIPRRAGRVDYEGELVVVMKRRCRKVTRRTALSYVLGYTCGNDVSARVWQRNDMQWWRAKSSDTFSSFGPWIETEVAPGNLRLVTRLNGETVQDTNTSLLIHDVASIIAFTSQVVTLEPGDVIYTGTSGATRPMNPGDVVEVELEQVGVLRNPVVAQGRKR